MAGPRKYLSGAAKRKARAAKLEARREARAEVTQQWAATSSQSLGQLSKQQFDPNGPAVELPIYGVQPSTLVSVVNAAIIGLEQGHLFAAAMLVDGMTRDDRVRSKLEERLDALVGADMEVEPAKDTQRARDIADDYEDQQADILPSHQVAKLLRNGRMLGVGIAQVLRKRTPEAIFPTIYVWNNRFLRYDWTIRRYCLITENRGEIALDPDDPEWVIYEPFGPHGWVDSAIVRSVALPWLIRYWTRTWWARHAEVHGSPIRVGIIPAERDPADEKLFLKQLANIAHEAVVRLPQGQDGNKFDIRLIEAAANTWEGFEHLLQHCDDSIAISFVGQKQSTTGQGGLGSQEKAGESTILRITRSDALIYSDLRKQVVRPWTVENYGDANMAPYLCPQIEPPEDEGEKAKTDLAVGQSLLAFKNAGAPLDVRAFLEDRGYPLLTEEEHAKQKQQAIADAQAAMRPKGKDQPGTDTGDTDQEAPPNG